LKGIRVHEEIIKAYTSYPKSADTEIVAELYKVQMINEEVCVCHLLSKLARPKTTYQNLLEVLIKISSSELLPNRYLIDTTFHVL
jgi:hypothetical protein